MNRLALLLLAAVSMIIILSCTKGDPVPDPEKEKQEQDGNTGGGNGENGDDNPDYKPASSKTLVTYYSFSGDCRAIVQSLTGQLDADVLEILPAEPGLDYAANNYAIGSSLIAAIREKPADASSYPAIKPVDRDASEYDNIIIVTPLWWGNMSAIMQSYLFRNGSKMAGKHVGLVVSSHSSGISGVIADAKRLVPQGKFHDDSLWINASNRSKSSELIRNWLVKTGMITESGAGQGEDSPAAAQVKVAIAGKTLLMNIADNATAKALVDLLRNGPVTYEAHDYGGFEKVGALGHSLPTSDSQITAQPGDVILYNGTRL